MEILIPFLIFSMLGTLVLVACGRYVPEDERRWLTNVLVLAFAARMILATAFAVVPALRIFHEDAEGYEHIGLVLAASWTGRGPPLPTVATQNTGYWYVCGALDYLFGAFKVNASYFNATLGAVTIFVVYRLARTFVHTLVARRAALLVAFMPSMILWSSIALKDPLMSFLIAVCLLSCIRLKQEFSLAACLGVIFPIAAMQPIRFYMVYFIGFAVVASFLFDRGVRLVTGIYKQIFVAAAVLLLFVVVGLAGRAEQGAEVLSFDKVSAYRVGMAKSADSGFSAGVDISTPTRALTFLPVGMSVFLLGPFPWQMTSLRALMAAPETMLWWLMFPSALRGLRFITRERFGSASPLLLFTVTLTCAYSLIHGNVGSGFRQRAQIFVILFIFAALGRYQTRCRRLGIDEKLLLNQ